MSTMKRAGRKDRTLLLSLRAGPSGLHMRINRKILAMGTCTTIEPQAIPFKILRWSCEWNLSLSQSKSILLILLRLET